MESLLALGGLTTLYVAGKRTTKGDNKEIFDEKHKYNSKREKQGFSKSVQNSINLVTFDKKTEPVGSYKYKVHAYPSDIDIFEIVHKCCSLKKLQKTVVTKLKTMAKNIKNEDNVFLGDFKAGIDDNLYFEFGEIDYMSDSISVKGYDPKIVISKLKEFKRNGWINELEYKKINKMTKQPSIGVVDFYNLYYEIRDLYILRWDLDEIIDGSKTLRSGGKLKLSDAITHDSIIKVDIFAPVDLKYTEVTNFFYLMYEDSNGNDVIVNKKLGNYIDALDGEINQYSSTQFRNSLKLAKRMWIKYNLLRNEVILTKLYPLFYSGAAILNQVKSEAETIQEILVKYEAKSPDIYDKFTDDVKVMIANQLDNFKRRLNNIYDIKFETEPIYKLLNKINASMKSNKLKETATLLGKFMNILKPIIEHHASNYLIDNNIIKMRKNKPGIEGYVSDGIPV